MPLIEVRGLSKFYKMGDTIVRALDGVDLSVDRGEFIAIIGPSGSGKSTMMHLLGCLDRPSAGAYRLDGRNVHQMSVGQLAAIRNRQIGFVFQTFNLIQRTTALDNVCVPLFYARRGNARGPARRALERVGLGPRASHRPNELSGGERQRVAIARAIVNDPLLIFADEPTGNLDSRTGEQIMQIFHDLNAQGVTIVLVTHEMDVALQARRIVQMRDGRIIADRPANVVRQELGGGVRPVKAHFDAPAGDGATPAAPPGELPQRRARGATAALVLGALAPLCALAAGAISATVERRHLQPGAQMPSEVQVRMLASLVGMVLAILLGIAAIFVARRILKRADSEPAAWIGLRRARGGRLLGWVGMLAPFALAILSRVLSGG